MLRKLLTTICCVTLPFTVSANELEIVNIRVGQGDATLIQGPPDSSGKRVNVLFDAGDIPKRDGGNILRAVLKKYQVNTLDFLIISHDDADHLGGVAFGGVHGKSFLLGFNDVPGASGDDDNDGVENWIKDSPIFEPDPEELGKDDDVKVMNFVDYGDEEMRDDVQAIQKYQRFARTGTRITIDDQEDVNSFEIDLGSGAKMTCYAGNGFVRGGTERVKKVTTPNEKSLSFLVTFGDFDFLISGDLIGREDGSENAFVEKAVGEAIVREGRKVDVLHVNHHGADNASEKKFLELIKPHIAIISAGNGNSHEHPTNGALQRLVDADVYRIFQTSWGTTETRIPEDIRDHQAIFQQDIMIRVEPGGKRYFIETSRDFKSKENN